MRRSSYIACGVQIRNMDENPTLCQWLRHFRGKISAEQTDLSSQIELPPSHACLPKIG